MKIWFWEISIPQNLKFPFYTFSHWVQVSITPDFSSWNDPKALTPRAKWNKPLQNKNKKVEIKTILSLLLLKEQPRSMMF